MWPRSPTYVSVQSHKDAEKPKRRPVGKAVADAGRQAWSDLRSTRWAHFGLWMLYWSFLLAVLTAIMAVSFPRGYWLEFYDTTCLPDGSFSPLSEEYDFWDISGFFDIALAAGPLTFTNAKIIDISWQLVVGRGGQALIGLLSWRVFADYIATKMAEFPVTYATFWVTLLHQEPTFMSTYRLARDFCLYAGTGSPTASTFIVGTVAFALAFPTLVNSMTGYVTSNSPYIRIEDGSMVPFEEFEKVAYVIHDGHRVNLKDDYIVFYSTPVTASFDDHLTLTCMEFSGPSSEQCAMLGVVSNYVAEYGFYGLTDEKTTWMKKHDNFTDTYIDVQYPELNETELPAPALDISVHYASKWTEIYGADWVDPRTQTTPFEDFDKDDERLAYGEELYSWKELKDSGKCQPSVEEEYQWGFSSIQIFIMLVLLLVWSTGLCILWQKAQARLKLGDEAEVPRGWRAIIELARTMERELDEAGIDVTKMTDRRAKKEICKRLRGGAVSLDPGLVDERAGDFRAWVKREKWWAVGLVVAVASTLVVWFTLGRSPTWIIVWYTSGGILGVVRLGSTTGSRMVMLAVLGIVGTAAILSAVLPDVIYL